MPVNRPCFPFTFPVAAALCVGAVLACSIQAAEGRLAPKTAGEVRNKLLEEARQGKASPETLSQLTALWEGDLSSSTDAAALLETAVQSWGVVIPDLQGFARACQEFDGTTVDKLADLVKAQESDSFRGSNLHAYLGKMLAEQRYFDEALQELKGVDLSQAIDPAAVLFYRAVAAQEVLEIPAALTALDQLTTQTEQVPARYLTVAELMRPELEGLESQSLGEIARMMHDSERRLDLGRAGERVQGVQEKIVANLDEIIKKLEAQQGGGGGGGGAGSSNSNESSAPADDSRVKGSTAPGETDDKKFSKKGNWGDLPEKEQAQAKNLINREFPSHYRQAIETYFKKLAGRPAPATPGR